MARSRNIKPGFFTNDLLAEIDPLGRILFAGIWTVADREGRLLDRPNKIKAEVLPFDNCDVDTLLGELHKHGFILRYPVDGVGYIQVTAWKKHQNPHIKEVGSTIPAPVDNGARTVQEPGKEQPKPERARLIPDSLNLIPDPLVNPCATDSIIQAEDSEFDRFWKAYPRKVGKGEAEKSWGKAYVNGDFDQLMAALERQKQTNPDWRKDSGQYIPNPATWINQKRWLDEPTVISAQERKLVF